MVGAIAPAAHALGPNAIRSGFDANSFPGNDDGSVDLSLPFAVNFFGTSYNSLALNNNGNVTFDGDLGEFTPFNLFTAGHVIIAPFFADVDTRVGNVVQYGESTVDGHDAWGATWPGVGCFSENTTVLNYFQLVLIDRSDIEAGDFDIEFNYDQIQWDAGQASGGDANCTNGDAARAGFSNGTAANSFEIPGSGVNGAFLDSSATGLVHGSMNSSQLGRYVFGVRAGQPLMPTTLTTSLVSDSASGATITVPSGTPVNDTATLSGANAASATGTVTYTVYSDSSCETAVADGGTASVNAGVVGQSDPVTLTNPGTYYWQASYSGDALNAASKSNCGDETETVTGTVTNTINLSSSWSPANGGDTTTGRVNSGGEALWTVDAANGNTSQDVTNAVVTLSIDNGAFDLKAMKTIEGTVCAKSASNVGKVVTKVDCNVGNIAVGGQTSVQAVVSTAGVSPTTIAANASAHSTDGSSGANSSSLIVDPVSSSTTTAFVLPGGTISVGTKTPTADNPIFGLLTLPKKEFLLPPGGGATAKPKPVPGPGVALTLQVSPASTAGNACGGQPCEGDVIRILNPSCPDVPTSCPPPLEGYNDPAHPVLVNLTWFGPTFANSTLYIIKGDPPNEIGTLVSKCTKVQGQYTNTPCVARRNVNKKTGQIKDLIAILFGDPGGARRG
jgi:hypothetical protein